MELNFVSKPVLFMCVSAFVFIYVCICIYRYIVGILLWLAALQIQDTENQVS